MLTNDNVRVTIDAILRYKVEDMANDAILNIENFDEIIKQVSQMPLRNIIASVLFQDVFSEKKLIITLNRSFHKTLGVGATKSQESRYDK